jgi:Pyruvate/2-oxoacid:ferredoxin oxidoreductase delta subunit
LRSRLEGSQAVAQAVSRCRPDVISAPCERFAIDYDFCKGCGICVAECPCGAIEMVPEQI